MKPFARMILVSFLAIAAGCVSRIDIEHWTLEPCDAATTAEIARLVEEGVGHGWIMPCAASFGSGEGERLVVVKAPRTYHNGSQVYVFDQSFKCVWESEEIEDRRSWRAVVSPSHPDSVFLYNKHVACYRLLRREMAGLGNSNANKRSERK